jgi:hypothetical protein
MSTSPSIQCRKGSGVFQSIVIFNPLLPQKSRVFEVEKTVLMVFAPKNEGKIEITTRKNFPPQLPNIGRPSIGINPL